MTPNAGIAQLVEHNLAKVGVASSSLVSRSNDSRQYPDQFGVLLFSPTLRITTTGFSAGWQSGYAAACKAVYAGSIPTPASTSKSTRIQ